MLRLRKILQSNIFYYLLLLLSLVIILIFTILIKYESHISFEEDIIGNVYDIEKKDNQTIIYIKRKEKIKIVYYDQIDVNLGDTIMVKGDEIVYSNNTIFNTFNYKKYLYNHHIYKALKAKEIKVILHSKNIFSKLKNKMYDVCQDNEYLMLFIVGDKSNLNAEDLENFQNLGVAHLIAISGMHVSVLIKILNFILKFIKEKLKNIIIILFLLFYAYIVSFSPSFLRAIVFYIIGVILKNIDVKINDFKKLIITFFILICIDPFYIYDIGFIYSFMAVLAIILSKKYLTKNYITNLVKITFFTLVMTFPITISLNYEINLCLFVANIFLIPYITFLIYPFSLLSFFFKFLIPIFNFFINIMTKIITMLRKIKFLNIIFPKFNIWIIVIYYSIIIIIYYFNNLRLLICLFILLFSYKYSFNFNNSMQFVYFDVKQGGSSIIISPYHKQIIMIDTSGNMLNSNNYILKNIILYLKSINISKLDYLVLTHGDYDHMGEAINLVNNFKVENVIFNCGEYNDLEQELLKVLDKKKIKYYSCIKELNLDKYKLQFLNTKEYDNENDNSNVVYFNYNNYKFLFMGDAGIDKEKDILEKYNLKNIDFLKVGHHGSNTSSSEYFIDKINPKYSLISVGKNNRYGHPKDEVLEILRKSKVYRTDLDGSIEIKLNKDGYKIRTCPP